MKKFSIFNFQFSNKKGFTLLELLVVISIIGLLVAMAVASYSTAQKKGRDSRRTGDMKAIQDAFEQYYSANSNAYPTTCSSGSTITIMAGTTFLIPTDPKSPTYNYTGTTCAATGYCICAQLENTTAGNSTNTSCNWGSGSYYCVQNRQ